MPSGNRYGENTQYQPFHPGKSHCLRFVSPKCCCGLRFHQRSGIYWKCIIGDVFPEPHSNPTVGTVEPRGWKHTPVMRGNTERQIPGDNSPRLSDTPSEKQEKMLYTGYFVWAVQVSILTRIFSNALTQVILTASCRWYGTTQENRKLCYTVCIHSTTSKLTNKLRNTLQVEAFKIILYLKCVVVPICRHSALCLYFLSILLCSGCFWKSTFELWSPQPIRAWVQDFINNIEIVPFSLLCSQYSMDV